MAAAASWIRGIAPSVPLLLVGYSFGAWCSVRRAVRDRTVAGVVAIGLPIGVYAFDELSRLACPLVVVQAEHDEFGDPVEVARRLEAAELEASVLVVDGTTHLFPGLAPVVGRRVVEAVDRILGARPC